MKDAQELASRYVAIWNEPEQTQHRQAIEALWSEGAIPFLEPPQEVREAAANLNVTSNAAWWSKARDSQLSSRLARSRSLPRDAGAVIGQTLVESGYGLGDLPADAARQAGVACAVDYSLAGIVDACSVDADEGVSHYPGLDRVSRGAGLLADQAGQRVGIGVEDVPLPSEKGRAVSDHAADPRQLLDLLRVA